MFPIFALRRLQISSGDQQRRPLVAVRFVRVTAIAAFVSFAAMATLVAALEAHDFWLIPDPFAVATGGTITIRGQSGIRFPDSESATAPNRVIDARLIGARSETRITELVAEGKSLRLQQRPAADGEYLVAVALQPRTTRTTRAGFRRYLELEGAADEAARLDREGVFTGAESLSYRSSKFAKTIVEVGRRGERAFDKRGGHALEFIPMSDPTAAAVGDTIALRVVANGQAVAGLRVHAGAAADSSSRVKGSSVDPDLHLLTDMSGVVRVPLTKSGFWNVRAAHVVAIRPPQSASTDEWAVDWSTFVFDVRVGNASASRASSADGEVSLPDTGVFRRSASPAALASSDSADAVNTALSFHAAIAAGDSSRALALLAPDAIILESGDAETREEYRSHHLPADIAFARSVTESRTPLRVALQDGAAWVASTATAHGEYRGRAINSVAAELMVLTRAANGWVIRSVHWSSHTQRAK